MTISSGTSGLRPAPADAPRPARDATAGPILAWALMGGATCAFSSWIFGQWLLSGTAFVPVPLTAADAISGRALTGLRAVELLSTGVALWALLQYLVLPWIRKGTPAIEGLLLVGALISYVLDTTVNYQGYLMAWNKHALNYGTWASFFPGHGGPTRYAEALLWGPPMYFYFGVALGKIQLWIFDRFQRRPGGGFAAALLASAVFAFGFDFAAESVIIRIGAYAWPYTVGALTVWPGTLVQFPLYEALLVSIYATGYMLLLRSARGDGVSAIERGCGGLRPGLKLPARLLAATGFATLMTLIYFVGFNLFSMKADTQVELPAYMMYADP